MHLRHAGTTLIVTFAASLLAAAPAAVAKKQSFAYPIVTSVHPLRLAIGQQLTVHGHGFRAGKNLNTVVLRPDGGRAVFVPVPVATTSRLDIVVPAKVAGVLKLVNGAPHSTRLRVRVLARRFGKSFTSLALSPVVTLPAQTTATKPGAQAVTATPPATTTTCETAAPTTDPAVDSDGDGLPDMLERNIGTDPCLKDTDGDGVSDAFEYWSALQLNSANLPYPGTRPYSNPLDPSDANIDFDGDGLPQSLEYAMWMKFGGHQPPPNMLYNDGTQHSQDVPAPNPADLADPASIYAKDPTLRFLDANHDGTISPAELSVLDFNRDGTVSPSELDYQDFNGDGKLEDDERDADGDGLTNYDEAGGRLTQAYWAGVYKDEPPYATFVDYAQPDPLVADSDGDGIVDGIDDQDDDGFLNVAELSRAAAQQPGAPYESAYGQVNPFNPCLPAQSEPFTDLSSSALTTQVSPDCMRHPPLGNAPAPFDLTSHKYPQYAIDN